MEQCIVSKKFFKYLVPLSQMFFQIPSSIVLNVFFFKYLVPLSKMFFFNTWFHCPKCFSNTWFHCTKCFFFKYLVPLSQMFFNYLVPLSQMFFSTIWFNCPKCFFQLPGSIVPSKNSGRPRSLGAANQADVFSLPV